MIETRKQKEEVLHDFLRNEELKAQPEIHDYYWSNQKFYSITRKSRACVKEWLSKKCPNKRVLDYCCGNGGMSIEIAKLGAIEVIGIDISEVSIENAKKQSEKEAQNKKTNFLVMDAEKMEFPDNYFDVIYESGVLHHLDLNKAYLDLSRVLKPEGEMICIEALKHNPIFHYYRKKTPHLRTQWETEHILCIKDIEMANKYFNKVTILGFFHLLSIGAVPFRNFCGFRTILSTLEIMDQIILRVPWINLLAWQVVYVLSEPKK